MYLVSGGNQFDVDSVFYQDRLLINDGNGSFKWDKTKLPKLNSNGCVVRPMDYDQDGYIDLFIGGHNKPKAFPLSDSSYLLKNINGRFENVTETIFWSLVGLILRLKVDSSVSSKILNSRVRPIWLRNCSTSRSTKSESPDLLMERLSFSILGLLISKNSIAKAGKTR